MSDLIAVTGATGFVGGRVARRIAELGVGQRLVVRVRRSCPAPRCAPPRRTARGKPIDFEDETLAEARASRAAYGAPEWQVTAWISTYTAIASGELAHVTDTVGRLAGHEPESLAGYVRAHPDCMDHVSA